MIPSDQGRQLVTIRSRLAHTCPWPQCPGRAARLAPHSRFEPCLANRGVLLRACHQTLAGGTGRQSANSAAISASRDLGGPSNRRSGILALEPLGTAVSMMQSAPKTTQRRRSPIPAQPWGTEWWRCDAKGDTAGTQRSRSLGHQSNAVGLLGWPPEYAIKRFSARSTTSLR